MKSDISAIINKNKYLISVFILLIIIGIILVASEDKKGYWVLFFSENRTDFLNNFFIFITKFGEEYPFIFLFFFFLYKKSRVSFSILATGITMPIFSFLLKNYFNHPRPKTYFHEYINYSPINEIENLRIHLGHSSFPSGHTFSAFALFILLALVIDKNNYKILLLILATLVGISRVYLAQHFLEDAIFGAILGFTHSFVIYYIFFVLLKDKKGLDIEFKYRNLSH